MTWPDDHQPRCTIATKPTVRVLDRAYNHKVVREWQGQGRAPDYEIPQAEQLAATLNANPPT